MIDCALLLQQYTPWSILIKFLFYCEINWKSPSKNPDVGDVSGTQVGFRIASLNSKWDIGWEEIKKLLTRVFTRIYFRSLWPSCRFVFLFSLASAPVLYIVGLHSGFRSWVVDYFNFIFFLIFMLSNFLVRTLHFFRPWKH